MTSYQWNFSNGNDYGNGNNCLDVNRNENDGICRNGNNITTEMITFKTYRNGNVCKENEKTQTIRTCSVDESLMLNHARTRSISISLFASHLWSLDLHGPPPRRTTFRVLHEVQVLKKPSSSTRTSVQSALDAADALDFWSQKKHQYHKLAPVVQAWSTGCTCLASLHQADFLRLLASDSGTPE